MKDPRKPSLVGYRGRANGTSNRNDPARHIGVLFTRGQGQADVFIGDEPLLAETEAARVVGVAAVQIPRPAAAGAML